MKKYRVMYACAVISAIILLFFSGNRYMFALVIAELLLPAILYGMLRLELRQIVYDMHVAPSCTAGEKCPITFEFHSRFPFIATGIVQVDIEFRNVLYGRTMTQELRLPSARTKKQYNLIFTPNICGEEHIICKQIVCYDVFGVCSVRLKPLTEQIVVVMPQTVSVRVSETRTSLGQQEGQQFDYTKKGNDRSEVYDMREYQPGDDMRSIHWKLSSKLDSLIVKEPGNSSHYDTVVLYDAGKQVGDIVCSEREVAGTMDFAVTFSQKLIEINRPHYVSILANDSLLFTEIESLNGLLHMVYRNMGVELQEHTGGALAQFLLQHYEKQFSKIIYIVNGAFPESLYPLTQEMDITAISVSDAQDEIRTMERGSSRLIEIPAKSLHEKEHFIQI